MAGFDPYDDIYRGLRRELFSAAVAAGAVDLRDPGAIAALGEQLAELVALLRGHAAGVLHPLLARTFPGPYGRLRRQHAALDPLLADLERETRLFLGAPSPQGASSLYRKLLGLIAAFLPLFDEEETLLPLLQLRMRPLKVA